MPPHAVPPNRKTKFSLHFVENRGELVSLYSQQANSIVYDAIIDGKIKELAGYDYHQREKTVDNSRIDIYLANREDDCCGMNFLVEPCYVEVKGVTVIVDGEARFPDAPTERGVKHLTELSECVRQGFEAYVFFVIQMKEISCFKPHDAMHPEFGNALRNAVQAGVKILAMDSIVTPDSIRVDAPVNIQL